MDENNSISGKMIKRKFSDGDESLSAMLKFGNQEEGKDEEDGQEKYDALPDDVLIRIIEFIPITQWPYLELIDHKFQRACHGAWRTLRKIRLNEDFVFDEVDHDSLQSENQYFNEKLILIFKKLVTYAPYITWISGFSTFFGLRYLDSIVLNLLDKFNHLERLSMFSQRTRGDRSNGISMTVSDLANFLLTSVSRNQLKELDVICHHSSLNYQNCQHDSQVFREEFENISKNDESILKLEILRIDTGACDYPSFDFLNTIDVSLLTKLDLFYCRIDSIILASLIARCSVKLEDLAFEFICSYDKIPDQIRQNTELIKSMAMAANLSILKMGFNRRVLSCHCYHYLFNDLIDLFQKFGLQRRLKKLSLFNLNSDRIISTITESMDHLRSLSLTLEKDGDHDFDLIIRLFTRLINLKELRIDGDFPYLYFILPHMANRLECLYLNNNDKNIAVSFKELVQLKDLKELHISGFYLGNGALEIWKNEANWLLEYLGLPNYQHDNETRFDFTLLLSFIEKMTNLRRLDLSYTKISDNDLESISISCPNLIALKLSEYNSITNIGIQKILDGCLYLKELEVPRQCEALKMRKYENFKFGRIADSFIPGDSY